MESLKWRLAKARPPVDAGSLELQIGRLLERNSRAAGRYNVRVIKDATVWCGLRVTRVIQSESEEWAALTEGCYILRTNVPAKDWTDKALWQAYTQLSDAEAAFRIQKSDLSIRPIWHQRADRVQAHILVCFLAYDLWKTLEMWSVRAGQGNSPRTIIDELGSIHGRGATTGGRPLQGDTDPVRRSTGESTGAPAELPGAPPTTQAAGTDACSIE